jgi:CDP-glycerol glycerophosphotransferase (TagB/SpsB family)
MNWYDRLRRVYEEVIFGAISLRHFCRTLLTRRPLVLIASHAGPFIGSAYFFLRHLQGQSTVCSIGLVTRQTRYSLVQQRLPWVVRGGWLAHRLAKRAAVVCIGGYPSNEPFWADYTNALRVLVWHGMPIKAIGSQSALQPPYPQEADCCIATSSLMQTIMQKAFPLAGPALCTGEPKTDGLIDPKLPDSLQQLRATYRKVILYAPTFRDAVNPAASGYFADTTFDDSIAWSEEIKAILTRHNACMIVAPHPAVRMHYKGRLQTPCFLASDLDVATEHLMAAADYLISDYSSVIIDWLLLLRPMGLYCPDIAEYAARRGFPYFDFEEVFAPFIHRDLVSLVHDINQALSTPSPDDSLRQLKTRFHQHEAGGAAARLLAAIQAELRRRTKIA